ncbi:MAG: helix-turn-helix transcriptional regulator [Bacteroidaceae bacterium]|nr:helix-turn-helix transcriptional regulator [Bacteroidaceae bacterium]
MKTSELFHQALSEVPNDLKIQIDLSWAISDKLAAILEERGMTQRDFAKIVGKTETEVSRWLGGTHNFTLKTIAKISSVLGCDLISV